MTCPICAKDAEDRFRPFCSKRCADVDLGKWLNGSYAVASQDPDDVEELEDAMKKETELRH